MFRSTGKRKQVGAACRCSRGFRRRIGTNRPIPALKTTECQKFQDTVVVDKSHIHAKYLLIWCITLELHIHTVGMVGAVIPWIGTTHFHFRILSSGNRTQEDKKHAKPCNHTDGPEQVFTGRLRSGLRKCTHDSIPLSLNSGLLLLNANPADRTYMTRTLGP
ncbi:MAG: hypothetical protein BWY09_02827 [Candidatus Hydrogenedentes bacterium ADurb.Bin179]|nr:MAG: hypothetical protein BWY09_02827 [Candidatus Hydrogenedentes bacterium ADurb.Bin179]